MTFNEGDSLRLYYSGNNYPNNYIDCWCKRWDEGNWDVTIELPLGSGARDELFQYVTPGSYRDLFENNVLGYHYFIDSTFSASMNTLILEPRDGFGLSGLREKRTIVVKNISDTIMTPKLLNVKIEGFRKGKLGF